jgi:hypothetical protein
MRIFIILFIILFVSIFIKSYEPFKLTKNYNPNLIINNPDNMTPFAILKGEFLNFPIRGWYKEFNYI